MENKWLNKFCVFLVAKNNGADDLNNNIDCYC